MPREGRSRRSVGYRPFITCDDPSGVVECGTIRRHKSESHRPKQKNPNRVVSSWSSCKHIKTSEEDKPKDLLKGAVDLEESMAMLSKLQQHSSEEVDGKNLVMDPFRQEACDDDRRLDSSDAPSTSTSQSSIVHSSNFLSPESVVSPTSSKKKNKPIGSSLITKLVGSKYGMKKHLGDKGDKIVIQKKPAFDPGTPHEHDLGQKRRTLDQLIEALRFKGNSKTTQLNGVKSSYWSSIATMKPSKFSCLNSENPVIPKPRSEVNEAAMLLKMRIRTNPLSEPHEFGDLSCNEKEMVDRTKGKASSPGKSRPHKKHILEKNLDEAQKANGSRRKGERKQTPNSGSHLQSTDGDKPTISSSSSEVGWPKIDEEVSRKDVKIVNVDERFRDECERVSLFLLEESTRLAEEASQIEITDYVDDDLSSSNETPLSSCNQEEETSGCVTSTPSIDYSCSTKGSTDENKLKKLLLSSPPFINRIEKLFDLKVKNVDKVGNDTDDKDLNAKMLLDTANELVELYSYECSRACLPLLSTYKVSSVTCCYTSLDELLDQVCEEIEAFGCYINDAGESPSMDNLVLLVQEDLRSRKMIDGVWDAGWRNVGFADEIEEIIRGVEELVLEEILADLVYF